MDEPSSNSNNGDLPNYRLGKVLGIGSFGKVKLGRHLPTRRKVAIKIVSLAKIRAQNDNTEEKLRREIEVSKLLIHPNIIRVYEVIETQKYIYFVMELMESGDLFEYIQRKGKLDESEARRIFQQIIFGVDFCHRHNVAHRDLKPENIILDSKCNVKIIDFGLCNITTDKPLKTCCGSPNYASPEVILSNSNGGYAGPRVDVWSCGVILYALLCGSLPFDDENISNLYRKITGGIFTLPSHLTGEAKDLIGRMLIVNPTNRITIPEIYLHPWFGANLPSNAPIFQPQLQQQIDQGIVEEVIKMGFDKNHLLASLSQRLQNEATVAYYLLLDSRF